MGSAGLSAGFLKFGSCLHGHVWYVVMLLAPSPALVWAADAHLDDGVVSEGPGESPGQPDNLGSGDAALMNLLTLKIKQITHFSFTFCMNPLNFVHLLALMAFGLLGLTGCVLVLPIHTREPLHSAMSRGPDRQETVPSARFLAVGIFCWRIGKFAGPRKVNPRPWTLKSVWITGLVYCGEKPILLVPPRERRGKPVPSDDVWVSAHLCDVLSPIFLVLGTCCTGEQRCENPEGVTVKKSCSFPPFSF